MPKMFSLSKMFFKKKFAHENMKKTASKVAKPAQIQPKSQFLFNKNLPPRDFSIMTLLVLLQKMMSLYLQKSIVLTCPNSQHLVNTYHI